jgi:UDP-N-acetylmuramoyl-tripeptide--D-alanyl-D-alanine ligase
MSGQPLWTLDELIEAADAETDGVGASDDINGFSIDTRTLVSGDVFVPLTDQRDGHAFVGNAFQAGAVAALVRHDYERGPRDGLLLRVADPLEALVRIGITARDRLSDTARVVAVTGSAGKTTTKEMLRACFEATAPGRVHASIKSYNNHWGVPLTLATMPRDTEYGVFEIGMNHANEIRPLTKMVRPDIAMVTTVLPVHIGNFEDGIEGVAKAKAEIFEGLTPGHGFALVPRDNPHFEFLRDRAAKALAIAPDDWSQDFGIYSFGEHADADQGVDSDKSVYRADGTEAVFRFGKSDKAPVIADLAVPGRHNAANAAGVIAAWFLATMFRDLPETPGEAMPGLGRALEALETLSMTPQGRGQIVPLEAMTLIDESYNANPASVAAAMETLALHDGASRRIAVLGDMLELGEGGPDFHAGLKEAVLSNGVDLVFSCGPLMRHLHDALPPDRRGAWAPSSGELVEPLLEGLAPGDVIMIKGSLGSRMAVLTDAVKARYALR